MTTLTYRLQGRTMNDLIQGKGWRTLAESIDPNVLRLMRSDMLGRINRSRGKLAKINKMSRGTRYTMGKRAYTSLRIVDPQGCPIIF